MPNSTKNVFISHIHEDDEGLGKLKSLLKKHGMDIRDGSINSEKPNNATSPDYIKSQILAPKIDWASTMIVYITPDTKNSEWVNWEIERAFQKGKTIVGVWEHGSKGCDIPDALEKYGDAVVGWDGGNIINAVNGEYSGFNNPDGSPCDPQPIKRHACS
jgi:hypothetical protein